jgi:hypothetical protein
MRAKHSWSQPAAKTFVISTYYSRFSTSVLSMVVFIFRKELMRAAVKTISVVLV